MRYFSILLSLTAFIVLGSVGDTSAQVNWWRLDGNSAVTLEWSKVKFNGEATELDFFNTVGFLGAQIRVSPTLSLIGELPVATFDVEHPMDYGDDWYWFEWDDMFLVGNPFLGVEFARPGGGVVLRGGVRPPIASEEKYFASLIGIAGANDRFEAFYPELWTFSAAAGVRRVLDGGLAYQVLIGPTFMKGDVGDAELFADFSGFLGYYGRMVRTGVSLSGRAFVTADIDEFSDRFDTELGAVVGLRLGTLEPGIHFRYAMDEENRELVDYSYGINLLVNLPMAGE